MRVLDACCGSRMFWFDKENKDVLFIDKRELECELCDGRKLKVNPDVVCDFTEMPFESERFNLVVFDPPHLVKVGDKSWLAKKYGKLNDDWKQEISKGFDECFRVLKNNGVLIFKWNETDIPTKEIIKLAGNPALFGNKRPKQSKTQWIVWIK